MLHSFIISSNGAEAKLFKTINSLKKQTETNFEIIIINNDPTIEKESLEFLKDQFFDNKNMTIVFNSKAQSNSTNWNSGLAVAKGKYVTFVKEGDIFEPKFVQVVNDVSNIDHVDIIETKMTYNGLFTNPLYGSELEENKTYDLYESPEVYAYINQNIYGKSFKTKLLNDSDFKFRRNVRFDTLFLYKVLTQAKTFYLIGEKLISHRTSTVKYSVLDLVNQWPHILNYYRSIGLFKNLSDELNYAFFYRTTYVFLKQVKSFSNETLYKKVLKQAEIKYVPKIKDFIEKNEVFKRNKNDFFTKYITNFSKFISSELKKIK